MGNRSFGVSMPGEPLREIESHELPTALVVDPPEPPDKLTDLVLLRLSAAVPSSDRLRAELATILGEASEACARWEAFLDACERERVSELQKQHTEIREKGRQLQAEIEQLTAEFWSANANWNEAIKARTLAIDAVKAAKYQREHTGRFASDAQVSEAENRVAAAKSKAKDAVAAETSATLERNRAEDALFRAKEQLHQVGIEESRLRAQIDGKPFIDPELGLTT
jgi:chromosome segregation ATPase